MFNPSFGPFPVISALWGRARAAQLPAVARAPRAQAGCFRLEPGGAITLAPARPGRLRIAQGSAWVTLGGPYQGPLNDQGDLFLQAGETLNVPAGARLVMEPLALRGQGGAVWFDWSNCAGR